MGGSDAATDAEIIDRSRTDLNAFTELFRRHAGKSLKGLKP